MRSTGTFAVVFFFAMGVIGLIPAGSPKYSQAMKAAGAKQALSLRNGSGPHFSKGSAKSVGHSPALLGRARVPEQPEEVVFEFFRLFFKGCLVVLGLWALRGVLIKLSLGVIKMTTRGVRLAFASTRTTGTRASGGWQGGEKQRADTTGKGAFDKEQAQSKPKQPVEDEAFFAAVLGIGSARSAEAIRKAYRELVLKYHPDRVSHLGEEFRQMAEEKAKMINKAYGYFEKVGYV